MRTLSCLPRAALAASVVISLLHQPEVAAQSNPFRGLWVGSVALQAVNEVSVPLDEDNVPVASDPRRPTPTFDLAHLKILLHVNGAGQVNLLKDVAILNRVTGEGPLENSAMLAAESDLALVTDPRAYVEYPPQPAMRHATAMFDFGDAKATEALDVMVEEAAQLAADFAAIPTLELETRADQVQAVNTVKALIEPVLADMAEKADVSEAFDQFLQRFNAAAINIIVNDPAHESVGEFIADATAIRDSSFYGDSRALDMVEAVLNVILAGPAGMTQPGAHRVASSFADVANNYQRFISGKTFGDMIMAAAGAGGAAARLPGATPGSIKTAMSETPEAIAAVTEGLQAKVQMYDDTRCADAIDAVLSAMAQTAFDNRTLPASIIAEYSESAGRSVLSDMVARYPLPVSTPTVDYVQFVRSPAFAEVAEQAAVAAAEGAIARRVADPLYTRFSLYADAKVSAVDALRATYGTAALAMRTELPLAGSFGPGLGDPRLTAELAQPDDLGPPALTGRIYLPANHPTNPFRHRRHPDHTTGFNIERLIRFDFDGSEDDPLKPAGYGVDSITGVYREEVFGLHKPLGPEPETNPIGLKTEGRFELRRVSLIDTLNTR